MNKEQNKNRNTIFLTLKKEGFINETTQSKIAFELGYKAAINYTQYCIELKELKNEKSMDLVRSFNKEFKNL